MGQLPGRCGVASGSGLPDLSIVPQLGPQGLTICSLCCWCTLVSSSAWRFCCFRNCACSMAGSRHPSSVATRFLSLSHIATWAHREDQVLLPTALFPSNFWAAPRKGGLSLRGLLLPTTTTPHPKWGTSKESCRKVCSCWSSSRWWRRVRARSRSASFLPEGGSHEATGPPTRTWNCYRGVWVRACVCVCTCACVHAHMCAYRCPSSLGQPFLDISIP